MSVDKVDQTKTSAIFLCVVNCRFYSWKHYCHQVVDPIFLDSKLQTCSHGKTYIESIYTGVLQVWLGGITNLYLLFYEPIFSSFSKNTHGHESPSSKKHDIDDQNYFLKYAVKRYIFMIKLRYMMIHKFVYLQNA